MSGVASTDRRLELVDALRGFAALAVLFFHSLQSYAEPGALPPLLAPLRRITQQGYIGIEIFFALSGWCIAQRVHRAFRRGEAPHVFLVERFLRIFPTYWAALTVSLLVLLASSRVHGWPLFVNWPHRPIEWLAELSLLHPYVGTSAVLIVSWSLVYELGFYVIAAAGLFLRRRGVSSSVLLTLGIFCCLWPLSPWQPRVLLSLGFWPDFFVGALAWRAARAGTPRAALAAGAVFAALAALHLLALTERAGLWSVVTATALLMGARRAPFAPRLVSAFARVGVFSYSLYLIHVPALSPFVNLAARWIPTDRPAFVFVWLAALAFALAAGWLLNRWVEQPVERWRKNLRFAAAPALAAHPA